MAQSLLKKELQKDFEYSGCKFLIDSRFDPEYNDTYDCINCPEDIHDNCEVFKE
jgi:hypothetical protein